MLDQQGCFLGGKRKQKTVLLRIKPGTASENPIAIRMLPTRTALLAWCAPCRKSGNYPGEKRRLYPSSAGDEAAVLLITCLRACGQGGGQVPQALFSGKAQLSQAATAFLVGDIPLRKRFIW